MSIRYFQSVHNESRGKALPVCHRRLGAPFADRPGSSAALEGRAESLILT